MSEISENPMINQILLRKWAYHGSSYLGNDLYYLLEYIYICMEEIGEDNVEEMLKKDNGRNKKRLNSIGNKWRSFQSKLRKLNIDIGRAKGIYDIIDKKKLDEKDNMKIQLYFKCVQKISMIQPEIYALALFFLEYSRIKGQTIKSEDWRVLEHLDLKKLEVQKRKPVIADSSTIPINKNETS